MALVAESIPMPRVRVRRFRACKRKRALWKKSRVDRRVGGDPVNYVDKDGRWFGIDDVVAITVGAVVGGVTACVNGHCDVTDKTFWKSVALGAAIGEASLLTAGAATTAIGATSFGTVAGATTTSVIGGAIGGAVGGAANGYVFGGMAEGNGLFSGTATDIGESALAGAVFGGIIGGISPAAANARVSTPVRDVNVVGSAVLRGLGSPVAASVLLPVATNSGFVVKSFNDYIQGRNNKASESEEKENDPPKNKKERIKTYEEKTERDCSDRTDKQCKHMDMDPYLNDDSEDIDDVYVGGY